MGLDADVRLLSGVRPFDALPREAVQLIAFSGARLRLHAGDRLFGAGDPADGADVSILLVGRTLADIALTNFA